MSNTMTREQAEAVVKQRHDERSSRRQSTGKQYNGHNRKVGRGLIKLMDHGKTYPIRELEILLQMNGFNGGSVGPATSYLTNVVCVLERPQVGHYRRVLTLQEAERKIADEEANE